MVSVRIGAMIETVELKIIKGASSFITSISSVQLYFQFIDDFSCCHSETRKNTHIISDLKGNSLTSGRGKLSL
jgi:hypothetical protein